MPYTDFHYTPTGTGVISGKEVLEQTEDAINDLSGQISGDVQTAIDTANNALNTANTASADAQNAVNTANTAYTAATNAQNTANAAQTTATNAQNAATAAQNDVDALENVVTGIDGRLTTTEGNVTNLTTRMGTAEGNIDNLQTAVSTAQATANSAQQTATTARQQSYVFRYSSTALVASSTNSNSLLDNTDNLKVGDKVIDSNGVLFSITAIDTTNSTFTIGTALIDLAQDSDVVHKSGNETVGGVKTFSDNPLIGNNNTNITISNRQITANGSSSTPTGNSYSYIQLKAMVNYTDSSPSIDATVGLSVQENAYSDGKNRSFYPSSNNLIDLGLPDRRWANVYATNYYYGSNNVEFSTKFVTTDTAQTISGSKTFSSNVNVYNSDSSTDTANIVLKNSKAERGSTTNIGEQTIFFLDKDNAQIGNIKCEVDASGVSTLTLNCTNSSDSSSGIRLKRTSTGTFLQPVYNNGCNLGTTGYRWYDVQTRAVNGLEPSSLSLPSGRSARIDISSYFTNTGDNEDNEYVASANGYIFLDLGNVNAVFCSSLDSNNYTNYKTSNYSGYSVNQLLFPITKGNTAKFTWRTNSTVTIYSAFFIPCQGNV